MRKTICLLILAPLLAVGVAPTRSQEGALKSQADRVATIAKVKPSVIAIFARGGQGGGTGVLISADGYALTNFHVVQPTGATMQCGLPDGVLYDAVLVGQDKVGDVALIKLLPKKDGQKFPAAVLGDSDTVHEGDWSIAMGNPFLLSTDFTPTVTFGLVSGVHRYQYPAGTILEYTDCIQIDTSINPGNSGGPLFDLKGELIGINGRGSFDKRGRVNSGVGYAISINQIKNFMGHLHAGLDADHASLGALVTTQTDKDGLGRMAVTSILEDSDVARRGLELDDEILSFAGRTVTSVNQYRNVLGVYPRGWRLPLEFRREQARKEILARLMGMQKRVLEDSGNPAKDKDKDEGPKPKTPAPSGPPSPAAKFYEAKDGFANYYFNKLAQDRLWSGFRKHGDFSAVAGNWSMEGTVRLKKLRSESRARIDITEEKGSTGSKAVIRLKIDEFPYILEPLKSQEAAALRAPETSGGLLAALYVYHRLLTQGKSGFNDFFHGGHEPFYPPLPPQEGKTLSSPASLRVDTEVLSTRHGPFLTKWFFARPDQKLLGFEMRFNENEDPCEVYLSDYRAVDGRLLPHRMQVQYGDGHYGTFNFTSFNLQK
jgi:S1-C subfamily serine protease